MHVPVTTLNDDRSMPLLGLGTYKLKGEECERAIREAIEIGYRKFDTATLYQNEESVGKALRAAIAAGDVTRDELFVTSKVWHTHHGKESVREAFHASLDQLGLDYLDLYMIHWPAASLGLYVETFEEMARLQGVGQIASLGVANFYEETLENLIKEVDVVPVVNQVELHPGFTQPELRAFHADKGIVTEAWSPLARGVVLNNPDIKAVAATLGATEAQVSLRYLMQLGVSAIPKSAQRERLEENFGACGIQLTRDQMTILNSLDGQPGFGRMFNDPREFPAT